MGYIYDANGYHLDTLKVLKIMDWQIYIDVIFLHIFIKICIYYRI